MSWADMSEDADSDLEEVPSPASPSPVVSAYEKAERLQAELREVLLGEGIAESEMPVFPKLQKPMEVDAELGLPLAKKHQACKARLEKATGEAVHARNLAVTAREKLARMRKDLETQEAKTQQYDTDSAEAWKVTGRINDELQSITQELPDEAAAAPPTRARVYTKGKEVSAETNAAAQSALWAKAAEDAAAVASRFATGIDPDAASHDDGAPAGYFEEFDFL